MTIRLRNPRANLVGQRFGKLVVKGWAYRSKWNCQCDCGNITKVLTANLKRGNTGSCGCVRNILSSKRNTIHGLHDTHVYKTWISVRRRCLSPSYSSYKDYGARGITVNEEWAVDVLAFLRDMGHPPTPNHTLDRIDNNKGYEPGNCRWATPLEQGSNKRNNVWLTFQGKRYTLSQLTRFVAEECGIRPKQFARAFEKVLRELRTEGY